MYLKDLHSSNLIGVEMLARDGDLKSWWAVIESVNDDRIMVRIFNYYGTREMLRTSKRTGIPIHVALGVCSDD